MEKKKQKRKMSAGSILRTIILIAAVCVFVYSAWNLYKIWHGYHAASEEYSDLADSFTTRPEEGVKEEPGESSPSAVPQGEAHEGSGESGGALIEDAEPPVSVNWEELKAINPEIVGWIYVDAEPGINYPICQTKDNDYYLHRTFRGEYLFAGSIFEECMNASDFSDVNTIVYGHNMKNGSMFGMLKQLKNQDVYDANPYFWILTPKGNYRYHIFAAFDTGAESDVYTLISAGGPEALAWSQKMQSRSEVANSVPLAENDHCVILSTCTSDSSMRCVIIGKCVSSAKPEKTATSVAPGRTPAEPGTETDGDTEAEPGI
ncbi:MAG: class B sortase [Lachnospiraceae bacterium]|nr:class B sortase [Lachnospiraceae bacterium]